MHFGFAVPNRRALETIAHNSPILEIGAGSGYWSWELQQAVWDQNPHSSGGAIACLRDMLDSLVSRKQIDRWIQKALEVGIDPL